MATAAQEYAQKLADLVSSAVALPPEVQAAVYKLLQDANRQVLADLAGGDPASWSSAQLHARRAEIQRTMDALARSMGKAISDYETQAFNLAGQQVASAGALAGAVAVAPVLNPKILAVVQGYTADLVTGLTRDAAGKLSAAIQQAHLGKLTLPQLIEKVGMTLEGGKFSGIFSAVGSRAMSIAMNETMRVHSVASLARITAMAERDPKIQKQWKHLPIARVPRVSHILADGQVRNAKDPFDVDGEKLMYPRDPNGSPDNTINCHCLVVPYIDPAQLKPTDAERALLDRLGIRVTTERA